MSSFADQYPLLSADSHQGNTVAPLRIVQGMFTYYRDLVANGAEQSRPTDVAGLEDAILAAIELHGIDTAVDSHGPPSEYNASALHIRGYIAARRASPTRITR